MTICSHWHLKDNMTSFACFFVNFKSECTKYTSDLKDLLLVCLASMSVNVVQIHVVTWIRTRTLLFLLCTGALRALHYTPKLR